MKAIRNSIAAIAVPIVVIKLHLQVLVLSSRAREFHLLRANGLGSRRVQVTRLLGLPPVAKRLLRDTQFAGYHGQMRDLLEGEISREA
jgi:hypothetical protein